MHCNNVVIALVDDNKKPLREHDAKKLGSSPVHREKGIQTGRSCRVLMPFESEFKILVKNQNNCRVKLDITIDGATVSGSGLIIGSHMSEYIERSVDVSYKFKFVPANHEDVADPTNEENGNIVVTVWKEQKTQGYINCLSDGWKLNEVYPTATWDNMIYNNNMSGITCTAPELSINSQDVSMLRGFAPKGEAGAVIDGGDSGQTFGTTIWGGDAGSATKFIFYVRGIEKTLGIQEQKELAELERLKAKYER